MSTAARLPRRAATLSQPLVRCFLSTQPHLPPTEPIPSPPPPPRPSRPRVTSLSPRKVTRPVPDPANLQPQLPPTFGRNQILAVSNSTRALLEEIVGTFRAPIRYAFAYGSGVFEQEGQGVDRTKKPMLDFIFAVSYPEHWHSINLNQNPNHYALHARLLGSDFIGRLQDMGPAGVWFNPFVPVAGVVRTSPAGSYVTLTRILFRTLNMESSLSIIYATIYLPGTRYTSRDGCTNQFELSKTTHASG